MIPYRISFSGIRDYKPTAIDLSGYDEHILISGANGSGKSTLTFCWGAVMASSKVNIEGLRSKNLPDQQVWRAKIELVFQNDGSIDAARYVKFTLLLEQLPNSPIKKEFQIAEGDEVDEWEHTMRFTSSDKNFTFAEYKRKLLHKYMLDPDAFYLVWYQQDVNQFAVMRPEERFRIFSEMTGIEEMQKRLESIKEREKELESALQDAKNNQKQYKLDLGIWEQEKNRYLDQQRRLKEGFKQYVTALCTLEKYYEKERNQHKEEWERTVLLAEEKQEEAIEKEQTLQELEKQVEEQQSLFMQYEAALTRVEQQLFNVKEKHRELKREAKKISDEMKEINEKVNKLPLTEEQVTAKLEKTTEFITRRTEEKQEIEQTVQQKTADLSALTNELAELNVHIKRDQEEEAKAAVYLQQYTSSHIVKQELGNVEKRLREVKDEQYELSEELKKKEEERRNLTLNHYVSPRQQQSLQYFKRLGIRAFALRDLVEMSEEAQLQNETIFDTIKYSIFVDAKQFTPQNDLYHVPLPLIVPTESVVSLPKYFIRMKENLSDEIAPIAMKALWWVKQFLTDELPAIQPNGLLDQRGLRGASEKSEYILSEKAILHRLTDVEGWIEQAKERQKSIIQEGQQLSERANELRGIVYKVEQAEAFIHQKSERAIRLELQQTKSKQQEAHRQQEELLRRKDQELHTTIAMLEKELEKLTGYKTVYDELRKEREKIQRIQQLNESISSLDDTIKEQEERQEELIEQCNTSERLLNGLKRKQEDETADYKSLQRYVESLQEQTTTMQTRYLHHEQEWAVTGREKQEFLSSYSSIYKQVQEEGWEEAQQAWAELQAKSNKESAYVTFEQARKEEVNPLAPENYAKMKEEYEKSNHEVTQSQRMVEEIQEHLEGAKDRLETTIRMNVRNIHERFERYMEQFYFEGEVTWDMAENKKGEVRYYLYIKARKKGHRGKLEDISAKGRGGKVGSGVSGGEESLSSLLFALALLQTIEASPGYIILDEYDSALDDNRKEKVFVLFEQELKRKMIIVSPKSHDPKYLEHFSKALTVMHDASIPLSRIVKIKKASV